MGESGAVDGFMAEGGQGEPKEDIFLETKFLLFIFRYVYKVGAETGEKIGGMVIAAVV